MQVTQRRRLEQYGKLKGGYRRLHTPGRKPEILQLVARWLSRPGGIRVRRRVGTGFSDKVPRTSTGKFQKLRQPTCPFINLPEKSRGRWGLGITPAVMKRCQWVKPELIAQLKRWTFG